MCRSEGALSLEIRKQDRAVREPAAEAIVSARDVDDIYEVPLTLPRAGRGRLHRSSTSTSRRREPELASWKRVDRARRSAPSDGADRARRQVRAARGRLPVGLAKRCATRPRCRTHASRSSGSTPRARGGRAPRELLADARRRAHPGRLRRARHRGQDRRSALRARAQRPLPRASAWACRSRSRSSRAAWRGWRAQTRRSSTSRRPTR